MTQDESVVTDAILKAFFNAVPLSVSSLLADETWATALEAALRAAQTKETT